MKNSLEDTWVTYSLKAVILFILLFFGAMILVAFNPSYDSKPAPPTGLTIKEFRDVNKIADNINKTCDTIKEHQEHYKSELGYGEEDNGNKTE